MAKWVRHIFRSARDDGKYDILSGPANGGLALVKVQMSNWRLYHMKSGAGLLSLEGDYPEVRKFATAVVDLADWDALLSRDEIAAVPNLAAKIEGLKALFSDGEVHLAN